ncbi:MAG: hypothetical protein O2954_15035, partial [bacterium]|nr:hypothetical protein [bacterium]
SSRGNYDDTDHLLGDLYLLNLLEEDEVLRTFYRKCVEDSWQVHRDEKMAWFNFVYGVVLGEEYGDLEGSRWNLQMHPTCRILQPQMNSLRTDLEFFEGAERREALHPLPVHERASDNEYEWKGSPFRLDGWTSRIVALMEVSPHDPYVQVATDAAGQMYWSNTQGETWHAVEGVEGVRDVLFSPDYPWMVFAATDTGVYRTMDGGVRWENVFSKRVQEVRFRVENTQVLYAVGPEGVYRSEDLGEWDLGTVWQKVNGDGPSGAVFAVDVGGEEATVYMLTRRGLFAQAEHEQEWKAFPQISRQRGFSTVDPIGGDPLWLRVDPKVHGRLFRAVNSERSGVVVSVSEDGGHAWSPVVRELKPLMDWAVGTYQDVISGEELHRLREVMRAYPIRDLRVDPGNPDVWYGLMEKGVAVTRDAGVSWEVSIKGLDIPQVAAIWTPRHADLVMAGTPAGMYVSLNQAASWTDTSLILQEPGALRAEIGGVGYLTAYWMGRYHGFITEEQANAVWWKDA